MQGADDGARRGDRASWSRRSPLTADDIAAAVLAGIDRGDELIVPDQAARAGLRR